MSSLLTKAKLKLISNHCKENNILEFSYSETNPKTEKIESILIKYQPPETNLPQYIEPVPVKPITKEEQEEKIRKRLISGR